MRLDRVVAWRYRQKERGVSEGGEWIGEVDGGARGGAFISFIFCFVGNNNEEGKGRGG